MRTTKTTVLISGAGIAGPTLAYWLTRYGFTPTVIERAPHLRTGGHPVDVRAEAVPIAQCMGIWPRLQQAQTAFGELAFVNERHERLGRINGQAVRQALNLEVLEILRGDIAQVLYERTQDEVEYCFGDAIQTLTQDADGVEVTLARGGARRFDLVVGADGVHSIVRTLVFGDEAQFAHDFGYHFGVFTTDNYLDLDAASVQLYGVPRKQVVLRSTRDGHALVAAFLFQQTTPLHYDHHDVAQHKHLLAAAFAHEAWEVPTLLEKLHAAPDLYFDTVSQIRMPRWSHGRVVLLGDAGYCPALLSGQGTTLAMLGAYVLAGELHAALGDHQRGLQRYERVLRPIVRRVQRQTGASARFLVPATRVGLWMQTRLVPRLVPPVLLAARAGRRVLPRFAARPSRVKDYGNDVPTS